MLENAVLANSLCVGYGREIIVADIDIHLPRGQMLALVGSNGSGKSTLLKTIAGLIKPVSGTITVLGSVPLAQPGRVAYMGQFHPSGFMLPLRAIDVVRMARFAAHGLTGKMGEADEQAVLRAMELMDIKKFARTALNTLSGGQRQRVFIAQALAREASLVLLDEPATNMDASGRAAYREYLHRAAQSGLSAVIATHDIEEAAACDQSLLLAHRVVAYGKSEEILTDVVFL